MRFTVTDYQLEPSNAIGRRLDGKLEIRQSEAGSPLGLGSADIFRHSREGGNPEGLCGVEVRWMHPFSVLNLHQTALKLRMSTCPKTLNLSIINYLAISPRRYRACRLYCTSAGFDGGTAHRRIHTCDVCCPLFLSRPPPPVTLLLHHYSLLRLILETLRSHHRASIHSQYLGIAAESCANRHRTDAAPLLLLRCVRLQTLDSEHAPLPYPLWATEGSTVVPSTPLLANLESYERSFVHSA